MIQCRKKGKDLNRVGGGESRIVKGPPFEPDENQVIEQE